MEEGQPALDTLFIKLPTNAYRSKVVSPFDGNLVNGFTFRCGADCSQLPLMLDDNSDTANEIQLGLLDECRIQGLRRKVAIPACLRTSVPPK